jgi:predicted nucleic acid-binding protein
MILVDTCILSSLAKIDRLDLLEIVFKKHFCYISASVLKELDMVQKNWNRHTGSAKNIN